MSNESWKMNVGDMVAPVFTTLRAIILETEETTSEITGKPITRVTAKWLEDGKQRRTIAKKGKTFKFTLNQYGSGDYKKVSGFVDSNG